MTSTGMRCQWPHAGLDGQTLPGPTERGGFEQRFIGWLGTYAALCLVNAVWNYRAVGPTQRLPHVFWNLGLFAVLGVMVVVFRDQGGNPLFVFPVFAGIAIIKALQRRNRRTEYQSA